MKCKGCKGDEEATPGSDLGPDCAALIPSFSNLIEKRSTTTMSKTSKTNKSTKSTSKTDAARELREAEAARKAAELAAKQDLDDEIEEFNAEADEEEVAEAAARGVPVETYRAQLAQEDAEEDEEEEDVDDDLPTEVRAESREADLDQPLSDAEKRELDGEVEQLAAQQGEKVVKARANRRWAVRYLTRVVKDLNAFAWAKFGEDPNVIAGFAMQLDAVRARVEARKGGAPALAAKGAALKVGEDVHFTDRQYKDLGVDFDLSVTKFAGMQGTKTAKISLADGTCIFVKASRVLPGPRPAAEGGAS